MSNRNNINRGYQKLTVWQDAANLYVLTSKIFGKFRYELRRVGANQINQGEFEQWDILAYKLENGIKKLIESLQYKREKGEWDDSFIVKESNTAYVQEDE